MRWKNFPARLTLRFDFLRAGNKLTIAIKTGYTVLVTSEGQMRGQPSVWLAGSVYLMQSDVPKYSSLTRYYVQSHDEKLE